VLYSEEAVARLKALDKATAKRIIRKITGSRANPHLGFKRLAGRPEYKLRIGDYRVIADIDESKKVILVRTLGHRKNIYDNL
jgi:mRNA interferase RelE/StbE